MWARDKRARRWRCEEKMLGITTGGWPPCELLPHKKMRFFLFGFFLGGGLGIKSLTFFVEENFSWFCCSPPKGFAVVAVYAVCFFNWRVWVLLTIRVWLVDTCVYSVSGNGRPVSQSASQSVNLRAKTSIFNFDSASRNKLVYCARSESEITTWRRYLISGKGQFGRGRKRKKKERKKRK